MTAACVYIYNYIEILNDLCHKRYIEQLDYLIQSCLLYLCIYYVNFQNYFNANECMK